MFRPQRDQEKHLPKPASEKPSFNRTTMWCSHMTTVTTEGRIGSYWICKLPTLVIEPSFEESSPRLPSIPIGM